MTSYQIVWKKLKDAIKENYKTLKFLETYNDVVVILHTYSEWDEKTFDSTKELTDSTDYFNLKKNTKRILKDIWSLFLESGKNEINNSFELIQNAVSYTHLTLPTNREV